MNQFEIPSSITIAEDLFGPGTDWRTMDGFDNSADSVGTGFAVFTSQADLAAEALCRVQPLFMLIDEGGRILTEEEVVAGPDEYTPNFVFDAEVLPGIGACICVDTKGVLYAGMSRTMLRLISKRWPNATSRRRSAATTTLCGPTPSPTSRCDELTRLYAEGSELGESTYAVFTKRWTALLAYLTARTPVFA